VVLPAYMHMLNEDVHYMMHMQNSLKGGYRIVHDNPRTQEVTHMPRVTYLQRSVFME